LFCKKGAFVRPGEILAFVFVSVASFRQTGVVALFRRNAAAWPASAMLARLFGWARAASSARVATRILRHPRLAGRGSGPGAGARIAAVRGASARAG
jgi:hypothetical protein